MAMAFVRASHEFAHGCASELGTTLADSPRSLPGAVLTVLHWHQLGHWARPMRLHFVHAELSIMGCRLDLQRPPATQE